MKFSYLNTLAFKIEHLLGESDAIADLPIREILEFAQDQVKSVEEIAARVNWMGVQSLETEIAEKAFDLLSNIKYAVQSHSSKLKSESSSMNLEEIKEEIEDFAAWVRKMEEEYADELYNPSPPQDEVEEDEQDYSDVKMIGSYDQFEELKGKLLEATSFHVLPLVGMPGIGKTTLASKVFADSDVMNHFDLRVWVTVGRRCQLKQIPRRILARVDPDSLNQIGRERDVANRLRERLKGKRYLVVLDNLWEKNMEHKLRPSRYEINALRNPLPYQVNGSCVLVTTRLEQGEEEDLTVRLLNKQESWDLLCEKVFGEESCYPAEFEKAGKKIAENCEGLPLTIIAVADRLSKAVDINYWNKVAAKKNHKLFKDVYRQISKVILPSYNYLPRLLRTCFLHMGIFPQNHEIRRTKLVNMWNVDGFLKRNDAIDCLEELVSNSLAMIYKNTTGLVGRKGIKTCGLHSSLWHFSTTEARKTKFCHVLSSYADGLDGDIIGQCRLSFHNNILSSIKCVHKYVEDNCAPTARSLLYFGPYSPFEVPVCFNLKLLRELDIRGIRFYEFPVEVLQLVELRYLTLTFNGKLPASISQLSNLRFLIFGRHFVIIKHGTDRYLPVEIWNMRQLQHLKALGSDLPDPPRGASLENLSHLSYVSGRNCTKELFKAIPNLDKLGFQIELTPSDEGVPLKCFEHISHLKRLTFLKCVIANPMIIPPPPRERLRPIVVNPKIETPLAPITILPSSLIKLILSGLGFPWKETTKIASLPHLKVLKLRNYAFKGPEWRVKKGFPSLQYLVIEDSDIVEWSFGSESFMCLEGLTLKDCYKYERMVGRFGTSIRKIEFEDCSPLGILQMKEALAYPWIQWRTRSSFSGGELKPLKAEIEL